MGFLKGRTDSPYPRIAPLAAICEKYALSIVLDLGKTYGPAYSPEGLEALVSKFPSVTFVIEHLGFYSEGCDEKKWRKVIDLSRFNNVSFGTASASYILRENYPYSASLETFKYVFEHAGGKRVMFGTDIPTTLKLYGYPQLKDFILMAEFLTVADRQDIFYNNALKLYFK